jgi:hypothetical protein
MTPPVKVMTYIKLNLFVYFKLYTMLWSRVLEKLIVFQLLNTVSACQRTPMLVTVVTKACCYLNLIQLKPIHSLTKIHLNIILVYVCYGTQIFIIVFTKTFFFA